MNLREYINKETSNSIKKEEDEKRQKINESIAKENFKKSFNGSVFNGFCINLDKVVEGYWELNLKETSRQLQGYPFKISYELELSIDNQTAQYTLNILADKNIFSEGVMLEFESIGYDKILEIENKTFEEIENLNVEEYLTKSFMEFKKFD